MLRNHQRLLTSAAQLFLSRATRNVVAPARTHLPAGTVFGSLRVDSSRFAPHPIHQACFSSSPCTLNQINAEATTQRNHSTVNEDGSISVCSPPILDLDKYTLRMMRDFVQKTPLPPTQEYVTLSFYQFRPIPKEDLVKIQYFFLNDLRTLNVVGRIYISEEGINAQISCPKDRVEEFKEYYSTHWPIFDKVRFNRAMSEGRAFKKLHVRIRKQLVSDGISNSTFDIDNAPVYLTPEEWHNELSSLAKPPVLIDMRNHYESSIGHFEHAIRPDVTTFRENVDAMLEICEGKEDQDIYMYCTGGIRCTRSGALLKSRGFKSVKMLQGGVTAYGRYVQEKRQSSASATAAELLSNGESSHEISSENNHKVDSIYKGKNFTFDKRLGEPITDEVLANCHICGTACDVYSNCSNTACNLLMISCPACQQKHRGTCGSGSCIDMVKALNEKQKKYEQEFPKMVGMKARLGLQPIHEHGLRVRPSKEGLQAAGMGAGVGLLVSAVQNSVGSHSHGAIGIISRTGSSIGIFAAMAGVFAATDSAVANVRETKDAWNSAAAGCAAGLVAGGYQRSGQTMVFGCVGMAAMMTAFDLSGSSLKGKYADVASQK
ncbi:hypothetical protein BGW38_005457 [Lunasporangiospora selenospora]|uniref:Rhodanese domain-containing protein n=1 Tax=Lunasporangiospora selenospora TaxID=979761 RepID=A0A9P6G0B9_9FUNG|nr:hypothetical protein BGW38_005457 [Lunasporangiospora selenospora]